LLNQASIWRNSIEGILVKGLRGRKLLLGLGCWGMGRERGRPRTFCMSQFFLFLFHREEWVLMVGMKMIKNELNGW